MSLILIHTLNFLTRLFILTLSLSLFDGQAIAADNKAAENKTTQATKKAVFAGGCFWCMEPPFEKLDGVLSAVSGYAGGHKESPTYQDVTAGGTGHLEVVEITYDPKKITFEKLLEVYWKQIDPTDAGGAFCDRGESYTTAIFYSDEQEKTSADNSKAKLNADSRFKNKVATKILKLNKFYEAEDYHQDYYKKNPLRYKLYRNGCGRDKRLKEVWGNS